MSVGSNMPEEQKECKCEVCEYRRHVEHIKHYGSLYDLRNLIDDLYERYMMTDFDLDVWEAIGQGVWPSSRKAAVSILENADAFNEKERDKETWKAIHRQTHKVVASTGDVSSS